MRFVLQLLAMGITHATLAHSARGYLSRQGSRVRDGVISKCLGGLCEGHTHPELYALHRPCSGEFVAPVGVALGGTIPKEFIYPNLDFEQLMFAWKRECRADLHNSVGRAAWATCLWQHIQWLDPSSDLVASGPVFEGRPDAPAVMTSYLQDKMLHRQRVQLMGFLYAPQGREPLMRVTRKLSEEEIFLYQSAPNEVQSQLLIGNRGYDPKYTGPGDQKQKEKQPERPHGKGRAQSERPPAKVPARGLVSFPKVPIAQEDLISQSFDEYGRLKGDIAFENFVNSLLKKPMSDSQITWFHWATYCTENPAVPFPLDTPSSKRITPKEFKLFNSFDDHTRSAIYHVLKWLQENERNPPDALREGIQGQLEKIRGSPLPSSSSSSSSDRAW